MPQLPAADAAKLAQIEEMLAKGMNEEQILQALNPVTPTIGPAPQRNPIVETVLDFAGIRRAGKMDPADVGGTFPIPLTDYRVGPADVATNYLGGKLLAPIAGRIPGAIRSLMTTWERNSPAAVSRGANSMLNDLVPGRMTPPSRMLPPHTGDIPIPRGVIDDLMQTPDLPPGYDDFINPEIIETAVMGTKPPVRFVDVAPKPKPVSPWGPTAEAVTKKKGKKK